MTAAEVRSDQATIAVMTALVHEFAAMKTMLDDPVDLSTEGKAPGEYVLGTIPSKEGGKHVVVLGLCSAGENLAAVNTAILLERLPRITAVVMVGIAGGVPDHTKLETDIRLGDVVVCSSAGTIQYDHDKELLREGKVVSEPRPNPRPPSERLLRAASQRCGPLGQAPLGECAGGVPEVFSWQQATSRAS